MTSIATGAPTSVVAPVTIYTSSDCHWCAKAKQYLTQRGVGYIEKNVEADEAIAREAIEVSGQRGVPIITVGSQVIIGFQRRALDQALGLGAVNGHLEAVLPPGQDTVADLLAAKRVQWTPEEEAIVGQFRQRIDTAALCGYVGQQLDYFPGNCDDTFRHVRAFLAAHPLPESEVAPLLGLLGQVNVACDCAYAANLCR